METYNVTYDGRSRLTQQNWIVPGTGGGTFRLDFTYNSADQPTTLRYPGGAAGQQGELVTTGYNARGQVTEQRLDTGSNGLTRQYEYDWQPGQGHGQL